MGWNSNISTISRHVTDPMLDIQYWDNYAQMIHMWHLKDKYGITILLNSMGDGETGDIMGIYWDNIE